MFNLTKISSVPVQVTSGNITISNLIFRYLKAEGEVLCKGNNLTLVLHNYPMIVLAKGDDSLLCTICQYHLLPMICYLYVVV